MDKNIKLVKNEPLKKLSKKRYYITPIISFVLMIMLSFFIYYNDSQLIVDSLNAIITVNTTLFATNLAVLIFIVPYFITDKTKHIEFKEKIQELKFQNKVGQPHLEKLKKIDTRIILDSQILNYLFYQTCLLVITFSISVLTLVFTSDKLLITAINSSHVLVEIVYIINLLFIMGIRMYTKDLNRMYANMISYETNLLNNSGTIVQVLTNKDIKEIKRKCKQKTKL